MRVSGHVHETIPIRVDESVIFDSEGEYHTASAILPSKTLTISTAGPICFQALYASGPVQTPIVLLDVPDGAAQTMRTVASENE